MKKLCKLNANVYGYIETKEEPILLSAGTTYEIKKVTSEKYGVYYEVLENKKLVTTLSEGEVKVFFEN
jgi:hypothetical protein